MLFALWLSRSIAQIRTVMVVGSSALLISAIALTVGYLQARAGGDTSEMLFRADTVCRWYLCSYVATFGCHRIYRYIRLLAFAATHQRILSVVHLVVYGCIRVLYLNRPVHNVHVL